MTRPRKTDLSSVEGATGYTKDDQANDPTPLWIPLAVIFIFVPIMLAATIVFAYLFF